MSARSSRVAPREGPAASLAEPLLNCEQAAALLNVRVSWVRDAARLGHLPCLRVGRHLRFTRPMARELAHGTVPRRFQASSGFAAADGAWWRRHSWRVSRWYAGGASGEPGQETERARVRIVNRAEISGGGMSRRWDLPSSPGVALWRVASQRPREQSCRREPFEP